uniref:C3H1-type domain-containing protein n=1 Tax=Trypanosoma vivax (strain Y486) TaxID=1055687 RepID=G0U3Z6_TRYVY|nr:conserved hypothetical protein [Trypanosoma vivax Y486]
MQPFLQTHMYPQHGYDAYSPYGALSYPTQRYRLPGPYPLGGCYPSYPGSVYNLTPSQSFDREPIGHICGRSGRCADDRVSGNTLRTTGRGLGDCTVHARKKKPFVGGSLETQRQWERQTICCFFLQKSCKFATSCRFLHEDDLDKSCQHGARCRAGHADRAKGEKGMLGKQSAVSHHADTENNGEGQQRKTS